MLVKRQLIELKTLYNLLILFLIIFLCGCGSAVNPDSYKHPKTLLKNVRIVDVENQTISELSDIEIQDGKITAIYSTKTNSTREYQHVVDGNGEYISPGLIDMHVHAYDPAAFTLSLAHGVTHVRVMHGIEEHIVWRNEIESGKRIGSTMTVSSPIISGFENASLHHLAHTPEQARHEVSQAKAKGYDLIKAYGNLSAPVLAALVEQAEKESIPVAKHGPHPSGDMAWSKLENFQSLEHVEDIFQGILQHVQDETKLNEAINTLEQLGVPITPTLNIYWQLTQISKNKQDFLKSLPSGYISPVIAWQAKHGQVERWLNANDKMVAHNLKTLEYLQKITAQLHTAGIELLVGSDAGVLMSPHGIATLTEMKLMQNAGISPFEVLRSATLNPAIALGMESKLGQVKVGLRADLVVTHKNPAKSVAAFEDPSYVLKKGRVFSKNTLEKLKQDAIESRSFWQELYILLREL